MPLVALATDFDGTLATDGVVGPSVDQALERWRASGRRLILVTGRQLPDLRTVYPCSLELFDGIVAENGPVLFSPGSGSVRLLAAPPPGAFVADLRRRQVEPLSVGEVVVATSRENAGAVLEAIEALDLELEMIFNKDSLMVLPAGVSKATGLSAALEAMAIDPRDVAGIGDGENDAALIGFCGLGVAVANAVPDLKANAMRVTRGKAGDGVIELIDEILARG